MAVTSTPSQPASLGKLSASRPFCFRSFQSSVDQSALRCLPVLGREARPSLSPLFLALTILLRGHDEHCP